jgi:hypothetical protein
MFQKAALLPSSCKETPNMVDILDQAILSEWIPQKHSLRYASENRSSRWVVTGKLLQKKLKTTKRLIKLRPETLYTLKP